MPSLTYPSFEDLRKIAEIIGAIAVVAIAAFVAFWIAKKITLRVVGKIVRRTRFTWDDALFDNHVFARVCHLIPALVIHSLSRIVLEDIHPELAATGNFFVSVYLVGIGFFIFEGLVNSIVTIIGKSPAGAQFPMRGFGQALKLIAFLACLILFISILFGKDPVYILSGFGALTAILMLIFRDAILGFVAGIQLSINDMVRVGDWIEMPTHGADGDVLDVSLTTVKVRNWDKTFTTVPAYDLISQSFKNWRGMSESGGRRIKRSINIDVHSVRFMDDAMRARFARFQLLEPYLSERLEEIEAWNERFQADLTESINGRRLTNLGCFRAYCLAYLRHHPGIRQDMTFLVRHLQPGPQGLPVEIYIFTKSTQWVEHESVQADVFDHLLAVLPLFELSAYQYPSDRMVTAVLGDRREG